MWREGYHSRAVPFAGLCIAGFLFPAQVRSQDPLPACPSCEIRIENVVTLRSEPGEAQPDSWLLPTVVQDSRGSYYVAPMMDRASVGVYRPDGVLAHTIGGTGSFTLLLEIKVRGDTLIAVDRVRRSLELIPLGHGESRVVPLGYSPEGVLPLDNGSFVTQAHIPSPRLFGMPLHVHGPSGEHLRTFGRSTEPVRSDAPYDVRRSIAYDGDASILASWVNRYRIERWSIQGRLVQVIEHQRPWFPHWSSYPPNIDARRPPTWLESVRVDSTQGVIWCILHVAGEGWSPDPRRMPDEHAPAPTLAARNDVLDTIIEVLDMRTGQLLASRRVNVLISGYLNDGANIYTSRREDESGNQQIDILQLSFLRSRS